ENVVSRPTVSGPVSAVAVRVTGWVPSNAPLSTGETVNVDVADPAGMVTDDGAAASVAALLEVATVRAWGRAPVRVRVAGVGGPFSARLAFARVSDKVADWVRSSSSSRQGRRRRVRGALARRDTG